MSVTSAIKVGSLKSATAAWKWKTRTFAEGTEMPKRSEQSFEITAKLYEARNEMKRFWDESYEAKIAEFRPILEAVMRHRKLNELLALSVASRWR